MKLSNISQIKTTILGVLIFLTGLAYILLNDNASPVILLVTIGTAIALMFAPDTLVRGVKSIINSNKKKEIL